MGRTPGRDASADRPAGGGSIRDGTIPGHATAEGTRDLAERLRPAAPHGYATLGATGLTVSRLGFGCYRVDDRTPEHREALQAALRAGCNLIDTSTNYADGASERLVGATLEALVREGGAVREGVVVVSKIGYVQGTNLDLARERERAGRPFPEMVKVSDDCWHCIHPEFLADQLARSRERLRLATLDVCLLHNPEYFLSDARKRRAGDLEARRAEFYRRMRDAFACLEEAARRGEILWYGVSSNTAAAPLGDPEATSVGRMLAAAEEAGGKEHRLRVLQIPMNLFEPGGALERNTGPDDGRTALEEASAAGLGVLVNRPLNAFVGHRLLRLAAPPSPPREATMAEILARLRGLEEEYAAEVAPHAGEGPGAATPADFFRFLDQVAELPDQIEDYAQWQQVEQQYVIPRINHLAASLGRSGAVGQEERWTRWWERCRPALHALLVEVGRIAGERSRERAGVVAGMIDPALPAERRGESLSRKALWIVASTPGVTTVLVGMRRPEYVADAAAVLAWPPLPRAAEVYGRLHA
jgi:hypothetical protein